MKLHIVTQVEENYGAHDWDGEGECPQRWKMKGGNDYLFDLGPAGRSAEALDELAELFRTKIGTSNEGYREYIIGYGQVAADFQTDFECSQLEYDGVITFPAKVLELA